MRHATRQAISGTVATVASAMLTLSACESGTVVPTDTRPTDAAADVPRRDPNVWVDPSTETVTARCSEFGSDFSLAEPLAPRSLSRVPSQHPVFCWSPSASRDDTILEICRDRWCVEPEFTRRVGSAHQCVQLTPALDAGMHFWRACRPHDPSMPATGAVWEFQVLNRDTHRTNGSGSVLDLNGDGYADLLVSGRTSGSGVDVQTPLGVLFGSPVGLQFGGLLAPAPGPTYPFAGARVQGDLDRDGFADVSQTGVIAEPTTTYQLRVIFGGTGPLASLREQRGSYRRSECMSLPMAPFAAEPLGDLDRNGAVDESVGTTLCLRPGSDTARMETLDLASSPPTGRPLGAFTALGDINGDGFDDVFASGTAVVDVNEWRRVEYLIYGASRASSFRYVQLSSESSQPDPFLWSERFGDRNGDGFDDVLHWRTIGPEIQRLECIYGGAEGLGRARTIWEYPASDPSRIAPVLLIGDVNGDGRDDALVRILEMSSTTLVSSYRPLLGDRAPNEAGLDIALSFPPAQNPPCHAAADINGDGRDDLVCVSGNELHVFFGGPSGLRSRASQRFDLTPHLPSPMADRVTWQLVGSQL